MTNNCFKTLSFKFKRKKKTVQQLINTGKQRNGVISQTSKNKMYSVFHCVIVFIRSALSFSLSTRSLFFYASLFVITLEVASFFPRVPQ